MKCINMRETGQFIRTKMDEKSLTAENIADMLGISSVSAIYCWLSGKKLPSVDHLVDLSELFDCKIDDLLKIDDV